MTALQQTIDLPKDAAGQALAASHCSAFRCIVADPPWKYGTWGTPSNTANCKNSERWAKLATNGKAKSYAMPYPTMTLEEIKALPVATLLAGMKRGVAVPGAPVWLASDPAAVQAALIVLAQKCHPMPQYVTFPLECPGYGNLGRDLFSRLDQAGIPVQPPPDVE